MAWPTEFVVTGREQLLAASIAALIREAHPGVAVRVVAAHPDAGCGLRVLLSETGRWLHLAVADGPDADTVQALADGAATVVTLSSDQTEFHQALVALSGPASDDLGSRTLRWMAERTAGLLRHPNGTPHPGKTALTGRERAVLRLLAEGLSTEELARALEISSNTVRSHVRSLSMKLEVSGRARVLAAARAQGFPEAFAVARAARAGEPA